MTKRFHYFDINGIGEGIRYLLHYGAVKFDDVRYDYNSWPKVKDSVSQAQYGQLPIYEESGKGVLNQSIAIAKYIGHTLRLVADDPWKDAQLDAAVFTIFDYWAKVIEYFRSKDETERATLKKVLLTETIDYFFSRFEKMLKENKGYIGGKLTWADFILVGIVDSTDLMFHMRVEDKYPMVKALVDRVTSFPAVKSYIASRKPYIMPAHAL